MTDPTIAQILARLDVIERRLGIVQSAHPFLLDDMRRIIICPNGKTAKLNSSEWMFLQCLLAHPHQVVRYADIKQAVWNSDWIDTSNITVLVYMLRQKIETDPHHPRSIVCKKGVGMQSRGKRMAVDYTTWHRVRGCEGKVKYQTRSEAKKRCKYLARCLGRKGLEPYWCSWCSFWHVGHRNRK